MTDILYATGIIEAYHGFGKPMAIRSTPAEIYFAPPGTDILNDVIWFLNAPDGVSEGDRIEVRLSIVTAS